jgi:hypothetical protein
MANPSDLLHAWESAIRELGGVASSLVSGPAELAAQLGAPLQRQAVLLEQILQRQVEFERDVVGRVIAPARIVLDVADQTTAAMHAQANAFRVAAASFGQVADLLEQQATLLTHATGTIRDPVSVLRTAGGALRDTPGDQELPDA